MFLFCVLSLVIANRVKIASRDSPEYILTLLGGLKNDGIRFMKESEVVNPTNQSGFEINGNKAVIDNNGVFICDNFWGSEVSICEKSKFATVFNVIKTDNDVTFKTDSGNCLTMSTFDSPTKGYVARLKKCADHPSQKFKLVDMPKIEEKKTPLAPLPNETNDYNGNNSNNNGNSQNTGNDSCSNVNISNAGFKPVTCNTNYIPLITEGSKFNGYFNPYCLNTKQSGGPTSFISVFKFRRPAQPGNECNNHQIWSGTFRRYY